jgi:mycofactocin precursor
MVENTVPETVVVEDTIEPAVPDGELIEEDLLVEDISIDGMCGVY